MDKIFNLENGRMTRTLSKIILPVISALLLFVIAFPVQADSGTDGLTQIVDGYHISLVFAEDPAVGENQIHVQIHDAMDRPVSDAAVEVTLARVEEGHSDAKESSGHDSMAEMHSAPTTGHGTNAHEEMEGFPLEASHHEAGEYSGEIHVESTGNWMVTIHLTVKEQGMEVDFPLMVKSSSRNIILASFAGINLLILAAAATLKRKPASQ